MKEKYISPSALMLKLCAEDIMNASKTLTFSNEGEGDAYSYSEYFVSNS